MRTLMRFEDREPELRRLWEETQWPHGERWEDVRPGYRLGWEAGVVHGEREWDEIEPQLAARWPDFGTGNWRHIRSVVRSAYEQGRRQRVLENAA
ncbi:MAG: hypothetical protein HYY04_05435 [Chloroflexi bacterium]|nr:hypothetical protein [Chloroflexota bacterium]